MCFATYFNYTFLAAERGGAPYVYSKRSKKKAFYIHALLFRVCEVSKVGVKRT
jgi:hypothetical protein